MVSSPVSDLLRYSEDFQSDEVTYTSTDKKLLKIFTFEKDCVKMVSVNNIELPFAVFKEMVDELDVRESIPNIYTSVLLIFFVFIVFISPFALSNLNARV